jgi:cytochrome-b5 reductase
MSTTFPLHGLPTQLQAILPPRVLNQSLEVLGAKAGVALILLLVLFFFDSMGKKKKAVLDPKEWRAFVLASKTAPTHDTMKLVFNLPDSSALLGLPIGQHIQFRFIEPEAHTGEPEEVIRSYTPTTGDELIGQVEFIIKVYRRDQNPRFPEGGRMSQYLESLEVGDAVDMRGPKGHVNYCKTGELTLTKERFPNGVRTSEVEVRKGVKKVGMICGGTGLTPMLQILKKILFEGSEEVWMIYANQSTDDILLREELETLSKSYSSRFHLHFTVDKQPSLKEVWVGHSVGFIDERMVADHMPPMSEGRQVLMCGPPPMIKFACKPNLEKVGYGEKNWVIF